ncbi:MAG TPA: hypothetical protein DD979_13440 [Gammaproteobacteria bacterium]|jgi:anti-sigma-K factor RskA|nr:hypothetical protein [Gammaproteobacteria bacterium]
MNYQDPELLEHLAAEYVLGTLRGQARRRFERLQMESLTVRQAVWAWEQRLCPIAEAIDDEPPPAHLWHTIQQRTHPQDTDTAVTSRGLWHALWLWRSWGAVATVAAVILSWVLLTTFQAQAPVNHEPYMAVFNDAQAQPLWVISSDLATGQLSIRAVNAEAAAVDKAFELWMLPNDGSAPRSLGLLPINGEKQSTTLASPLLDRLRSASGLAVSIEPAGGSPTNVPTGPVVYQAPLIAL